MTWPVSLTWLPEARKISRFLVALSALLAWRAQADASVPLAWDAAPDASVAGYKIYFGTTSHTYNSVVDVGNVTAAGIPVPADGTTYFFAATTYDTNGVESDFSNETSYTVPTATNSTPGVPPTLPPMGDVSCNENAGLLTVNFFGVATGSGSSVSLSASSSNPALVPNPTVNYTSPNTAGALTFTPAKNQSGTAVITVTADNGQNQNNLATRTFTVTVAPVNQPPTLDALPNLTLNYNPPAQAINLTGIGSGAANEFQALTVTAVSSNPKLIPTPTVNYSSPLGTGMLIFRSVTNAIGSAVITVTVNDGGASNNVVTRTFTVTVKSKAASVPPPALANQPASQMVLKGKSATFHVIARGTGGLKYQWKCNGTNIAGATGNSLTVRNCSAKQAGLYTVTVSNPAGAISSQPATLTVANTPAASLTAATRSDNGQFAFNVNGVNGYKYAVQTSTDLLNWISVRTNTAPFVFSDINAGSSARKFYRTVYVP